MSDATITPARLRELAHEIEFAILYNPDHPIKRQATAAALRAAADQIDKHATVVESYEASYQAHRRYDEERRATLAAREALLKRAMGELQNCTASFIVCGLMSSAEHANALAAEIAAALKETDNG